MNKLSTHKRALILHMLIEGMSLRSASRIAGVSITTVTKLFVEAGEACAMYHDEHVVNVRASHVQCDEIWAFCYTKEKNVPQAKAAPLGAGHVWTWVALDRDTKLFIAYQVGARSRDTAKSFIDDLHSRLANRVQITTDGHKGYLKAVGSAFGTDVDYAQLIKVYSGQDRESRRRYSPGKFIGINKRPVTGEPVEADISTSHVERQNLNMRMGMRRFTRLTNAFSKKFGNLEAMVSLYTVCHNFVGVHKSSRSSIPAVAAGLSKEARDMEWIVDLTDARAPKPSRPKTYRKRISN